MEKEWLFGFADNHPGGRSRELVDDAEHVLLEDFADGHGYFIIGIAADAGAGGISIVHDAKGGQNHRHAEGAGGKATDGGDGVFPKEAFVLVLEEAEVGVEGLLLVRG